MKKREKPPKSSKPCPDQRNWCSSPSSWDFPPHSTCICCSCQLQRFFYLFWTELSFAPGGNEINNFVTLTGLLSRGEEVGREGFGAQTGGGLGQQLCQGHCQACCRSESPSCGAVHGEIQVSFHTSLKKKNREFLICSVHSSLLLQCFLSVRVPAAPSASLQKNQHSALGFVFPSGRAWKKSC